MPSGLTLDSDAHELRAMEEAFYPAGQACKAARKNIYFARKPRSADRRVDGTCM